MFDAVTCADPGGQLTGAGGAETPLAPDLQALSGEADGGSEAGA